MQLRDLKLAKITSFSIIFSLQIELHAMIYNRGDLTVWFILILYEKALLKFFSNFIMARINFELEIWKFLWNTKWAQIVAWETEGINYLGFTFVALFITVTLTDGFSKIWTIISLINANFTA